MEPEDTPTPYEPMDPRWHDRSLDELIDFILERFHEPLRRELPALLAMAEQLETVHEGDPSCPQGLSEQLALFHRALEDHLAKEERILFPLIHSGQGAMVSGPVQVMMQDHQEHGDNLKRIRTIAHDFTPPPEADSAWRELYDRLGRLEVEIQEHIQLEDQVLFPRALRTFGLDTGDTAYLSGAGT